MSDEPRLVRGEGGFKTETERVMESRVTYVNASIPKVVEFPAATFYSRPRPMDEHELEMQAMEDHFLFGDHQITERVESKFIPPPSALDYVRYLKQRGLAWFDRKLLA